MRTTKLLDALMPRTRQHVLGAVLLRPDRGDIEAKRSAHCRRGPRVRGHGDPSILLETWNDHRE